nr:DUF1887 family CARF protein [uncultured Methanoregula sp.]
MKTLVCLISKQHIPNLLTVKTIRPNNLVLLVTSGMKSNADWFLLALAAGGLDYSQKTKFVNIRKENSVTETMSALNAAHEERPDDEWIVNITGGTKPMSIGAYEFAKEKQITALYIVESDQYTATDLLLGKYVPLGDQHVSAFEFLEGYGYGIRNANDLIRQNQRAYELMDLSVLLTAHHKNENVRKVLSRLQYLKEEKKKASERRWEKEGLILTGEERLWIDNSALRERICSAFGLQDSNRVISGHLERQAVEFLTGRWLEYFIYGLLVPFVPALVRCLQVGLTTGQPRAGGSNEFDISFMTERSLCIVECKTGSQAHDAKGNDVLYKMEAIKAGLGALRVRAFIATTSPNIIDPRTGDTSEALKNRASNYGCTIINGEMLKEWASLYLVRDPLLNIKVADMFKLKSFAAS